MMLKRSVKLPAAVVWSFWYDNRGVEDKKSETKKKKGKE